jgi:YD repeat-containing protein
MTDPASRTLTYAWTARNEVSSISESAGSTSYSYDNVGNQTGVTFKNSATLTRVFDSANRLTSVVGKTSGGTTKSSFSYGYNDDNQATSCSELDGSTMAWSYDGQYHLTGETRTGTNAYAMTYSVDGVGNRTSMVKGGTTTNVPWTPTTRSRPRRAASPTAIRITRVATPRVARSGGRPIR